MKKNLNEKAVRLELVKVNQSRFSAEVLSGNARVNLTQMAQPFGKSCKPTFWLRTEEAQRYLQAIARLQKCNLADLIEVRNGGVPGTNGTWCRDYRIALRFAQWLSPEFSIKVDEAILGLLTASRGQARPAPNGPAGTGCDRGATGASADKLTSKHVGTEADMRPAGAAGCDRCANWDAMNRVSTAKAQDVTDGIIDFNGMEG